MRFFKKRKERMRNHLFCYINFTLENTEKMVTRKNHFYLTLLNQVWVLSSILKQNVQQYLLVWQTVSFELEVWLEVKILLYQSWITQLWDLANIRSKADPFVLAPNLMVPMALFLSMHTLSKRTKLKKFFDLSLSHLTLIKNNYRMFFKCTSRMQNAKIIR